MIKKIDEVLQTLGAIRHYKGYRFVVMALELIIEDEDNLCSITAKVYSRIAEHFGCKECCIERNIRTLCDHIWKDNSAKLKRMAKYDLTLPPSVTEFLEILYNYIIRNNNTATHKTSRSKNEAVNEDIFKQ